MVEGVATTDAPQSQVSDVWSEAQGMGNPDLSSDSPTPPNPVPKPAPQEAPPQQAPAPGQPQQAKDDPWAQAQKMDSDTDGGGEDAGSLPVKEKSYWQMFKDKINAPIIDQDTPIIGDAAKAADGMMQQIVNHEISAAHPWRAQVAQWYKGSMEDAAKFVSQQSNPVNMALTAAGMTKSIAAKAVSTLANVYFAGQGAKAMYDDWSAAQEFGEGLIHGKLQGDPEKLQRFLYGASGVSMGIRGAKASTGEASDLLRGRIQEKLGINGDLADQVADKVQQAHELRQRGADRSSAITKAAVQDAGDILDASEKSQAAAKNTVADAEQQTPIQIGQMMRDAIPAVLQEQARVGKPFEDMKAVAPGAVTDAPSVRAAIMNTMAIHEIQDHEIPAKIFNALTKRGKGGDFMDSDIPMGPIAATIPDFASGGLNELNRPVDFGTLTKVRNDLWDASQSAKTGRIRRALLDAQDTVSKIQEDYAVKQNFGNSNKEVTLDGKTFTQNRMYADAKAAYANFKQELGGKLMSDFTKADSLRRQNMGDALAKILSKSDGTTMRQVLKMAGIDVSPLDDILAQKSEGEATLKEGGKEAQKQAGKVVSSATKRVAGIDEQTNKSVNDLGKESPIIEGRSDFGLVGKSNDQIKSEKLEALSDNARQKGIGNPYSFMLIMMGALRAISSPVSGAFLMGRGVMMGQSKSMVSNTLKNPTFQDWVIRESGVHPTNTQTISKMRRAIRSMATSGALAHAATTMAKKPEAKDDAQ